MKKVIDFLKENDLMTIATSDRDIPRASIVEYYMVGDSIIFATDHASIKATNLKQNKQISMSVLNFPKYVTIDGIVVKPSKDQIEGYNKHLLGKYPQFKNVIEEDEDWHAYFRVVPETAYLNDISKGIVPPEIFKA